MADDGYFIGIDLGMTNSVLAYAREGEAPEIQHWEEGYSKFPSVVMVTPSARYAGYAALARMAAEPKYHLQSSFKRMIGTDHRQTIYGTEYSVTEFFAMILRKMVKTFEDEHGFRAERAVIAVPADFGDAEREAVFKVAALAGIRSVEIINESDAAAISYCYDTKGFSGNIAIYDIGGGTFDITVISVDEKGFTVLCNEGTKYLGGRDWDLHLASIIQKKVVAMSGISPAEMDRDSHLRRQIINEAERLKIVLDRVERAYGNVTVMGTDIRFAVNRAELDEATRPLVDRTVEMTKTAVKGAGLGMSSLDRIVMVGGPSITPLIRSTLEREFPDVEVIRYDPAHAVARGAAIYARSVFKDKDLTLEPILNKTYGIVMGVDGKEKVLNIIYRNTRLPLRRKVTCRPKSDDQKELEIRVCDTRADPSVRISEINTSRLLSTFIVPLEGKISRGKTRIEISMDAEADGTVSLIVECNGHAHKCDLGKDVQMSEEEMLASMRKVMSVQ